MTPHKNNYLNLISLWHRYGAEPIDPETKSIWHNTGWPHRLWLQKPSLAQEWIQHRNTQSELKIDLSKTSSKTTVSLFHNPENSKLSVNNDIQNVLTELGFVHTFNQIAMYLPLSHWKAPPIDSALFIREITRKHDILLWSQIGSNAFAYEIDANIIAAISEYDDVSCFLAEWNGAPVATALTYQTDKTLGIHQVAVDPSFQGLGIARQLMSWLINQFQRNKQNTVVLQASEMGKPLYDSLGFQDLFKIKNFQMVSIEKLKHQL